MVDYKLQSSGTSVLAPGTNFVFFIHGTLNCSALSARFINAPIRIFALLSDVKYFENEQVIVPPAS